MTCIHGDLDRRADGRCRACRNDRDRGGPSLRTVMLPVEPLVALMPRAEPDETGRRGPGVATYLGYNTGLERTYHRARQRGRITLAAADAIAVKLGYHPAEIWGNDWWTAG